MKLGVLGWIALILVVVGAVNWGLVALFSLDLVAWIFGEAMLAKIVYILVALSGIYIFFAAMKQPSM